MFTSSNPSPQLPEVIPRSREHGPVEASLAVTCNTITHINLFERAFASECGISRSTAESNKVK